MVSIYHNVCSPLTFLYAILSNFKFIGHCKQYERVWYRINKKVFVLERENNRAKDDEIQSVNMHLKERY